MDEIWYGPIPYQTLSKFNKSPLHVWIHKLEGKGLRIISKFKSVLLRTFLAENWLSQAAFGFVIWVKYYDQVNNVVLIE